jgi:hypothetical protein
MIEIPDKARADSDLGKKRKKWEYLVLTDISAPSSSPLVST